MEIIPGYLYKYKSFDAKNYWKDILLEKRLYMARPSEFNDPLKGNYFLLKLAVVEIQSI